MTAFCRFKCIRKLSPHLNGRIVSARLKFLACTFISLDLAPNGHRLNKRIHFFEEISAQKVITDNFFVIIAVKPH